MRTGWTATGVGWSSRGVTIIVTAICVVVEKPGGAVNPGTAQYDPAPQFPEYQPAG